MKRLCFIALLAGLLIGAVLSSTGPGVSISYSPTLDSVCALIRGGAINEEWKTELASKVQAYRALWGEVGPRLLRASEQISGLRAPRSVTAHLTLCNVPSQSCVGISINMRYTLSSFTTEPVPLRNKVDTLFHEILHKVLAGHIPKESRMLARHAAEPECVRNHLHLLALQKATLLRLGEQQALENVVNIDGQLPGGCYKRAWSLVNATESEYQAYVSEIAKGRSIH
jgi:hypothetical protein